MQHKKEKEKLKKEYLMKLRLVLGTELSAKNKIQAIGSLAVPVFRYSFGIVNWCQEERQKLDRKMRELLTIHGQHRPKADIYCLLTVTLSRGLAELLAGAHYVKNAAHALFK